jgi:antibiotic biosynthesis monooxygenase (ABM) superfamily enzyme
MPDAVPRTAGEPVTVMIARRVAPGREAEFFEWAQDIMNRARRWDGFLGGGILRPGRPGGEWHIVYRFADEASRKAWDESAERAEALARAEELMRETAVHRISGLETWFELPGRTAPAPPRWKMALTTIMAVFPLALLVNLLLLPRLGAWPLLLRTAVFVLVMTVSMTWLIMPRLTRLLRGWLYPEEPQP